MTPPSSDAPALTLLDRTNLCYFTLSNARRCYSSRKNLWVRKVTKNRNCIELIKSNKFYHIFSRNFPKIKIRIFGNLFQSILYQVNVTRYFSLYPTILVKYYDQNKLYILHVYKLLYLKLFLWLFTVPIILLSSFIFRIFTF